MWWLKYRFSLFPALELLRMTAKTCTQISGVDLPKTSFFDVDYDWTGLYSATAGYCSAVLFCFPTKYLGTNLLSGGSDLDRLGCSCSAYYLLTSDINIAFFPAIIGTENEYVEDVTNWKCVDQMKTFRTSKRL